MRSDSKPSKKSKLDYFPFRWFVFVLCITSLLLMLLGWFFWHSYLEWRTSATKVVRLQELIGTIRTTDEILTMSARMSAVTGDEQWEKRYLAFEPVLDMAIKEAVRVLPDKKISNAISKNR